MNPKCEYLYLSLRLILSSTLAFAAASSPPNLPERAATSTLDSTQPQTLSDVFSSIRTAFDKALSLEGVPEESGYADPSGKEVPAFSIQAGESFGTVMKRVVAASNEVYVFEVIRGTPILRPNPEIVTTPNLLDTVVDLEFEKSTIWDALCHLARAVNRENMSRGGKPLYIHLQGPEFLELPPPVFLEKDKVSVNLKSVSAREAMCAIMEAAQQPFTYYFYVWPSDFSYVSVVAEDEAGKVMHGPRVRDPKKLDDWRDENIAKLQTPKE